MISVGDIETILESKMPGAVIAVQDLTGTSDHFEVRVVWQVFRGKSLIEQHKLVNQALEDALEDGRIHALKIKTYTPEQMK